MFPKTIHEHDIKYVQSQLAKIPYSYRVKACDGYSSAWAEAYEAEPEMRHKENKARHSANTRLREFTDKVIKNIRREK